MLEFLPQKVKDGLSHLNMKYVYELRLRAEKPTTVNFQGKYRFLTPYGVSDRPDNAIICLISELADCVFKAGKYSVYSVEEQIRSGYLTAENGERIGLAGEYVFEQGKALALRHFSSLCIRIPHEIRGCGEEIYQRCMRDKVHNLLIISAPGLGKTTILRDLGRILSKNTQNNILICDERGEIGAGDVGVTSDIIRFANKTFAFEVAVRTLRPEIIITDELSQKDCEAVKRALSAGVNVVASAHFSSIQQVSLPFLELFDRFVLLNRNEIGKIEAIYDADRKEVVC